MPPKARLYAGLALLVAIVLTGLALIRQYAHLTVYQGKPLKTWAIEYYAGDGPVRQRALAALQAMGSNAVPALIELLQAKDSAVRQHVWSKGTNWPLGLRRTVLGTVPAPDAPTTHAVAARALEAIGPRSRAAIPALDRALQDPVPEVRLRAAAALAAIGKESVPVLTQALADPKIDVRQAAAAGLGTIGPDASAAVLDLARRLKDQNERVRDTAARSLGRIGAPGLPYLLEVVLDEDEHGREMAANAVISFYYTIGLPARSQSGLTNDTAPGVRRELFEKLGEGAGTNEIVTRVLGAALKDPVTEVRLAALEALANRPGDKRPAIPGLASCLHDESPTVRAAAARTLGRIGSPARLLTPLLNSLLNDPDPSVQTAANQALQDLEGGQQ